MVASPVHGQEKNREYTLKAAYLYKCATYISWPEQAFSDAKDPFVIGVLGPDPVGANLRKLAKVKRVGGRKIDVQQFKAVEQVDTCHVLFMSRAVPKDEQKAAVERLSARNILVVGEIPEFLDFGGVLNFVIRDNHVLISFSRSAYEREDLTISARLLRIATVVK